MPSASPIETHPVGPCLYSECGGSEKPSGPRVPVKVGLHDTWALIDSGSHLTLVRADFAEGHPGEPMEVICVHGHARSYPTRNIDVQTPRGSFSVQAGVVPELPVPLLLGRDCPIFNRFWNGPQPGSHANPKTPRRRREHSRPVWAAFSSSTAGDTGGEEGLGPGEEIPQAMPHATTAPEETTPPAGPNTPKVAINGARSAEEGPDSSPLTTFSEFPVPAEERGGQEGRFATAQLEDEALTNAWAQVMAHDEKPIDPVRPLPYPHFATRRGLLYRVVKVNGDIVEQLIVPRQYVSKVLYMAHAHLLGAHLGIDKTRERVVGKFYWPGLKRDITDYCNECPECQKTAPRPTVRSPLIPLPIIEVPFQRIAMDIVGPLPKTSRGHRYLLVMMDYATRFPEAVALRTASAKNVARELFILFSRVGIAREILTDQGSCFMSRVMKEMLKLLQVKQLRTSVYHPQTDGLVERFNRTLKLMLKKTMEVDGKNWDQLLPYVLFSIREVPQASTGFSPFDLLYPYHPRGLLDLAKEVWESQPSPHRSVVEHVDTMKHRMAQVWPIVREHLQLAQQAQARIYNRGAKLRTFQTGEKVLVLIPSADCKFLAKWQGPYEIVERIGEVNYRLQQPGRRKPTQLYHVNLLKPWRSPSSPHVNQVFYTQQPLPDVPVGELLGPSQRQDLSELVLQHQDVFSELPGRTSMAVHDIQTNPGVTVRVRPYRIPEARRAAIHEEVTKMLKLGVIEESRSEWSSPVVLVPKPDGSFRFCNDFRKLNEVSKFDA